MLYKQLQRITELDQQIHDMHLRLADYYRERAELTNEKVATTAPLPAPLPEKREAVTDPQALYDQLKQSWPSLPTYKTLSKRLFKAATIIDSLIQDNHQLAGNLTVVAVPPQAQLDRFIQQAGRSHRYLFTEEFMATAAKNRRTSWNIIVLTGANFALSIDHLSDSLGKEEFTYKQFDCRGLGVREALAADLQGQEVVTPNNWTLLLNDATDANHVPCVTKQGDQLIFDTDDARCLLGNNYLQPAIAVK